MRADRPLQDGVWQHLTVSYDSNAGAGQLTVDRTQVASVAVLLPIEGSYNLIYVGSLYNVHAIDGGFINDYTGDIDELAIFSGVGPG